MRVVDSAADRQLAGFALERCPNVRGRERPDGRTRLMLARSERIPTANQFNRWGIPLDRKTDDMRELSLVAVRASRIEYLTLPLRAHDLLRHVPVYDVSIVDLPGGGDGRTIADLRALESTARPSRIATVLYGLRHLLGAVFGWDDNLMEPKYSLAASLSDSDRRNSEVPPGTPDGAFLVLYRFRNEELTEIRNATVHGYVCTALIPTAGGYRLYLAVYVIPVSWLTRPYLLAIEPFRRFLLYPAMLQRIRRGWIEKYDDTR
jgi:hypothetical protein